MTRGPAPLRATALLLAAVVLPGAAAAQYFPAQPGAYLLSATAGDGRALWINPAALVRDAEASVGADITGTFGAGEAEVTQLGATLASRGLAFGWSRTEPRTAGAQATQLPAINTFVLGLGLGDEGFSAGVARRWYRSSASNDAAWEIGARLRPRRAIELSLVWRDIGSPAVSPYRRLVPSDSALPARVIPGVGLILFGGRLRLAAEWESSGDFVSRVARVGWSFAVSPQLSVMGRSDLSSRPEERSFALAAQWRGRGVRAAMVGARPDAFDRQDLGAAVQLYTAPPPQRRRPRR